MSVEVVNNYLLEWIIKQGNTLFHQVESTCLPISNALLEWFTEWPSPFIDDLSANAAFKIERAGLLQLYMAKERKKDLFPQMKVALSGTSFVEGGSFP